MRVLGVSYGYHDSAVSLVENGRVLEYVTEERMTNIKHDASYPHFAINYCLKKHGLSPRDLDHVTFHEDPYHKFSRVFCASTSRYPWTYLEFTESIKEWFKRKLWALGHLQKELQVPEGRISYFSHHFSHALTAFMGSGFEESAILVMDAVGDWSCSSMYKGFWKDGAPQIQTLREVPFPNSVGLVYSAITAYLGFNPNDGECSTMALSSFGNPKYVADFREILGVGQGDGYQVDQSYFNFIRFYKKPYTKKFEQRFGPPKLKSMKYGFDCLLNFDQQSVSDDEQRLADIACSLQTVFEEILELFVEKVLQETGSRNLAYAGGCALNCKANSKVLSKRPQLQMYIPFDPGDGGTSMGTAQFVAATENRQGFQLSNHVQLPYIGSDSSDHHVVDMIDCFSPESFRNHQFSHFRKKSFSELEDLAKEIAHQIANQQIVGLYQGRSEAGPRALGNRSILIHPGQVDLARKLSREVKERSSFRPYALTVLASEAERIFESDSHLTRHAKWMQYVVKVKPEHSAALRAGLHCDLTTRAHLVEPSENPLLYFILLEMKKLTGYGAVINTSFNGSGYPIVGSASQALSMLTRTSMNSLVLGTTLLEKIP
jgi:carbamoyltransferase